MENKKIENVNKIPLTLKVSAIFFILTGLLLLIYTPLFLYGLLWIGINIYTILILIFIVSFSIFLIKTGIKLFKSKNPYSRIIAITLDIFIVFFTFKLLDIKGFYPFLIIFIMSLLSSYYLVFDKNIKIWFTPNEGSDILNEKKYLLYKEIEISLKSKLSYTRTPKQAVFFCLGYILFGIIIFFILIATIESRVGIFMSSIFMFTYTFVLSIIILIQKKIKDSRLYILSLLCLLFPLLSMIIPAFITTIQNGYTRPDTKN